MSDLEVAFDPPNPSFLTTTADASPRDSFISSPNNALIPPENKPEQFSTDPAGELPRSDEPKRSFFSRFTSPRWIFGGLAALILLILAIVLPVILTMNKHTSNAASASGQPSSSQTPTAPKPKGKTAITGGDGSTITAQDGSQFTYKNPFGGFWVDDPNNPFNNNAQCNSWSPPLNASWDYSANRIFGVNLGGWFVLEPFISPALFQKYPGVVDEWNLCLQMAADTSAGGGIQQLENHYNTFITEKDIAQIAGAGLNWVRVPIPFWAIEAWPGEPFLAKTSWKYILRLFGWCRKYGIRINLDLHALPGSQNAYSHSGRLGEIDWLNGPMGLANAQRSLDYVRIITEFISQPQYQPVIPIFGIVNEAIPGVIGQKTLISFYLEAYTLIRSITGTGAGNGPYISIHDGFIGLSKWANFLPGADRVMMDTHPYFAFNGEPNTAPVDIGSGNTAGGTWPPAACGWGPGLTNSFTTTGFSYAGEFSNAINDCGLFVNGVPGGASYGGSCATWEDATTWSPATKNGLMSFAMASMDALQNWFFWTWKIGNSTAGSVQAPLWSYQLGLEVGVIPTDPRQAVGQCSRVGSPFATFDGTFLPWQTGGAGAGAIDPAILAANAWPPAINNARGAQDLLYVYTATGTVATLPPPTFSPTPTPSVSVGNGWYAATDTASGVTTVAACTYPPDAWRALSAALPAVACGDYPRPVGAPDNAAATTARVTTTTDVAALIATTTATTTSRRPAVAPPAVAPPAVAPPAATVG